MRSSRFERRHAAGCAIVLAAVLLLGACDTPPHREPFPELTYQYLPLIRLDVARIEIVEAYPKASDPARVEEDFPTPPGEAAAHWGRDRLQAAGPDGVARFIVLEASVTDVPLPRTTGLAGVVTNDQSDRYDAVLKVRLEVENRGGGQTGLVTAEARETATAAEDMTLNERERLWFEMTHRLMDRINAELERQIGAHLGAFMR
jgi:hypothetical protein